MNLELTKPIEQKKPTNETLYHQQMVLLRTFLEHGAISRAQYEKSAGDLTEKMGFSGMALRKSVPTGLHG